MVELMKNMQNILFTWRVLEENFKSKHFSYLARIYTFADVLIVSIAKNVFVFG